MDWISLIDEYFDEKNKDDKIILNKSNLKKVLIKDTIEVYSPKYITFKIIPDMEVENNSNMFIAKSIHGMRKMFSERWRYDNTNTKIEYKINEKFFFDIIITKDEVNFYLTIPNTKINSIMPTINNVWSKCAISEEDNFNKNYKFNTNKTSGGALKTLKHNYFSLVTSKKENTPLSHILENQINLQENEKIRINICGLPMDKREWENQVEEAKKIIRQGKMPEKMMIDKKYIAKKGLEGVHSLFEDMYEFITLFAESDEIDKNVKNDSRYGTYPRRYDNDMISLNQKVDKDDYTMKKQNQDVFKTQIKILIETESIDKNEMMLKALLNNYNTMAGDNEFTLKKSLNVKQLYEDIKEFKCNFIPISNTILSLDEIGKLIMLPPKSLQNEFNMKKIDSREVGVSKELINKGNIIGDVSHKGKIEKVGFGEDRDSNSKPLVYLSEQGGGKTSAAVVYTLGALKRGETVITPDVADGKLIDNVINYLPSDFPEDHIIILDYSHPKYILPLTWNEIDMQSLNGREAMKISNFLTQQIKYFLDTLANEPLSDRMREYLSSAGRLVFRHNDSTVVDLLRCLTDYDTRHRFIKLSGLPDNNRLIQQMLALDTPDGGTKLSKIDGIVDRMSVLLSDANLELIMSQKPNLKIDFGKWMNDRSSKYGYFVGIRIPKSEFLAETTDTMVTFLVSKVWLATLFSRNDIQEKDRKQTHLILDEPHQYPQVMKFIKSAIKESRKWRLRFVMLTHTFDVFTGMKEDLLSAGCSFIMAKTTAKNFKTIEMLVNPFGLDDMIGLKQYQALCSINYKNVSHNFIAQLSTPPDKDPKNYKFKDRMYLYNKCAEEYGKEFVWEE